MTEHADMLQHLAQLPPRERAAALAHWIYVETSHRGSTWSMRVSDAWEELDAKAREFNLASIDTWARSPEILDAWIEAVIAYRREAEGGG